MYEFPAPSMAMSRPSSMVGPPALVIQYVCAEIPELTNNASNRKYFRRGKRNVIQKLFAVWKIQKGRRRRCAVHRYFTQIAISSYVFGKTSKNFKVLKTVKVLLRRLRIFFAE